MRSRLHTIAIAAAVLFVAGCTSIHRNPVPVDLADRAVIPGMPHVRDWGDEPSSHFQDDLVQSVVDQQRAGTFVGHQMPLSALLLSGGGSNGAFGAGFLSGWSEAGSRPTFKLVTGISTGALLAPFAFLGSDYDPDLERLYTTTTTGQIYRFRNPLTVLKKDSLTRTDPLAETLREIIDAPLLAEIADQHRRGRRLYVGTTNLDAQRLMVWNMGAIAAGGNPSALELFRQVLLASASIPVAFPPVYIPVDVDGVAYDEMHVDGGVVAEFFLWGAMVDIAEALGQLGVDPSTIEAQIFIIRNSQIDPEPVPVEPRLTHIAERSMITVLKSVAVGDLLRIWAHAQRNGVGFNFIGIPVDQPEANVAAFDPKDMRRLYDLGRSMALEPKPWRQRPPFVIPD